MRVPSSASLVAGLALAASLSAGCRDGTGVGLLTRAAAGTYTLESWTTTEQTAGTLVLTRTGGATRRLAVARSTGDSVVYLAQGTFEVRADGTIEFALHEDGNQTGYVWRPAGVLEGSRVHLRYGHPADGPDITETYVRE